MYEYSSSRTEAEIKNEIFWQFIKRISGIILIFLMICFLFFACVDKGYLVRSINYQNYKINIYKKYENNINIFVISPNKDEDLNFNEYLLNINDVDIESKINEIEKKIDIDISNNKTKNEIKIKNENFIKQ